MILILLLLSKAALAAYFGFNGLSQTPVMGWNSWNSYGCDINETIIRENAREMVSLGLLEAGYEYAIIDDCWQLESRNEQGNLVANPEKFPSGIKALSDYIHSLGLKFGMYSDAGSYTCGGYAGSLGYEEVDAKLFAEWEVDFLKYDNCFTEGNIGTPNISFQRFKRMSDALLASGRDIVYSISNWGEDRVAYWAHQISNSYRISGDIYDYFDRYDDRCPCESIIDCKLAGWKCSVAKIIEFASQIASVSSGKGRWADLDMLEIGNGGMSHEEYRTHFTFWAALKSPLVLGNKLSKMSEESKSLILSKNLIAINKDDRASPIARRWKKADGTQLWAGLLADGFIVIFYNTSQDPQEMMASFEEIFLDDVERDAFSKTYRVIDLWDDDLSNSLDTSGSIHGIVPSHAPQMEISQAVYETFNGTTTFKSTISLTPLSIPTASRVNGIIYDGGMSCSTIANQTFPVASNIDFYIALVDASTSSNCTVKQKINVLNGLRIVIPIIIFYNIDSTTVQELPANVDCYAMNSSAAIALSQENQLINSANQTSSNYQSMSFESMYTNSSNAYTLVQMVIIITSVLLALAFIASILLHYYFFRMRRNEVRNDTEMHLRDDNTPLRKQKTLSRALIDRFDTSTYQKKQTSHSNETLYDNATEISDKRSLSDLKFIMDFVEASVPETMNLPGTSQEDMIKRTSVLSSKSLCSIGEACIICLDEFKDGVSEIRHLPCTHFYHVKCIDEWLMGKSTSCPICKADFASHATFTDATIRNEVALSSSD